MQKEDRDKKGHYGLLPVVRISTLLLCSHSFHFLAAGALALVQAAAQQAELAKSQGVRPA